MRVPTGRRSTRMSFRKTYDWLYERIHSPQLRLLRKIMATQADLTAQIKTLTDQVTKIGVESGKTLQMVTDLQAQLGNADPALVDAVNALAAQIKVVDDMVPDAPTA